MLVTRIHIANMLNKFITSSERTCTTHRVFPSYGSPYYLFAVLLINFPTAIAAIPIASLSVVPVVAVAVTLVCLRTASSGRRRWWHVIRIQTLTLIGECAYHASNAMLVTVRTAVVRLQKVPNK